MIISHIQRDCVIRRQLPFAGIRRMYESDSTTHVALFFFPFLCISYVLNISFCFPVNSSTEYLRHVKCVCVCVCPTTKL